MEPILSCLPPAVPTTGCMPRSSAAPQLMTSSRRSRPCEGSGIGALQDLGGGRRTRVCAAPPRVDPMPATLSPERSAVAAAVIAAIAGQGAVLRDDQALAVAARTCLLYTSDAADDLLC